MTNKSFTLSYTYNLADQPKSVGEVMNLSGGGGLMAEEEKVLQAAAGARPRSARRKAQAAVDHSISGAVWRSDTNQRMQGVTITATRQDETGPNFSVQTNSSGEYWINDVPEGATYKVTASQSGYIFTPAQIILEMTEDKYGVDFQGAPPPAPSGTLTANPNPIQVCDGTGQAVTTLSWTASNVLNTLAFRANGAINSLRYGNGRRLQMGYNANRQQPVSMKVDRVSNPSDKVLDYAYEYYDQNGKNNNRIRRVTDNIDQNYTSDYVYDDYNRLTSAITGGYPRTYAYDAWGNTTNFAGVTHAYTTNASGAPATNRISSSSQIANFSYDAAGNMTQAGSATYGYDGASRLKSVNGTANTYGYDGNGGRVRVTDGGAAVFYVRSSVLGQVAMEVTSTGVRRAYVYAGKKLVAQQSVDGQFYWLHTNHLGSGRAMTDVNGNLVCKGRFDPYWKVCPTRFSCWAERVGAASLGCAILVRSARS